MSAFNLSLKKTTPSKVVFKPRLCDVLFLVRMEWLHFWETEAWLRLFSLTNNDFSLICLKYVYAYIFINVYIVIWMCVYKLCHVCFITQPTSVYFFSWPLFVFFFFFFFFLYKRSWDFDLFSHYKWEYPHFCPHWWIKKWQRKNIFPLWRVRVDLLSCFTECRKTIAQKLLIMSMLSGSDDFGKKKTETRQPS